MENNDNPQEREFLWSNPGDAENDYSRHYPMQVACSADGQTIYLICKNTGTGATKLLKSPDGGKTWNRVQP